VLVLLTAALIYALFIRRQTIITFNTLLTFVAKAFKVGIIGGDGF